MSDTPLEIWPVKISRAEAATVEKALVEDGYPASPEGLKDWIMDGIKYRGPDIVARAKRWMEKNPEKVEALKTLGVTLGKNVPFFLRALRGQGWKP